MPGKQMAIDADLNAGILTPDQARDRRAEVAAEADFYGAMDGAGKFVKGDAMAGILILAINIIGGILIGMLQHGMSLSAAGEVYLVLTIGDGLVAQIPALLLSIATAIIVTRVSSANDMSTLIAKQIHIRQAWLPVAGVMAIIGIVPGMPNAMFLFFAAIAAMLAWFGSTEKRDGTTDETTADGKAAPADADARPGLEAITAEDVSDHAAVSLQIGYALIPLAGEGGGALVQRITAIRREVSKAMGFVVPGVRIRDDLTLSPNQYRIRIGQAIRGEDVVYPDRKLAIPGANSTRKLKGVEVKDPSFGLDAVWILPHQLPEAEADDHVVVEPESVIATHLSQLLYKHAGDLIGPDDVQILLDTLARVSPTLVNAVVPKLVPLHTVTAVLRALLAERIPVGDLRRILEGVAELAPRNLSAADMAECLRPMLIPLLLQQMVPINTPLPLITLDAELEQLLIRARRQGGDDGLVLDTGLAGTLIKSISDALETATGQGKQAVVIVAGQLRRSFAHFLRPHLPDAIVMGINELPENRRVEVVASIGGQPQLPRMAAPQPQPQMMGADR
jgi:flagellar biosynthesis protein FlhA